MRLKSFVQDTGPNGTVEKPCFTCAHCSKIVILETKDQDMGFCHMCFYPTCVECGALDKCDPFEKKIERMESRARFLSQVE